MPHSQEAHSPFGMLALAGDIELSPLLPSLPTGGDDIPSMQLPLSNASAAQQLLDACGDSGDDIPSMQLPLTNASAAQQLLDACGDSDTFAPMYDRVPGRSHQDGYQDGYEDGYEGGYEDGYDQQYEPPTDSAERFLMNHANWQQALRESLTHADGYTRALLSAATVYHPVGTLEVLAGLSARQVQTLHPPCRELVQSLLRRTIAQAALVIPSLAQIQMAY